MKPVVLLISIFFLLQAITLHAQKKEDYRQQDGMDIRYLHVMLGKLDAEDSWTIEDDNGDQVSADRDDLIYGGVAAQIGKGDGIFQYGFESGGLISFKNDTSYFIKSDGGATARLRVKNELWMLDLSLGGFVSVRPWSWLRVYASAGPSIMIGSMAIDDDDVSVQPLDGGSIADIEFEPSSRETDVDVGVYGRAGIDIILNNGFVLGVSARKVDSEMDFGDNGIIELDDTQYFLTLGQAF
ncbi:hypothetical protein [Oceanicoccus sagamiensis]|uniref:Outer membrane protein beta-barrel domain-containing protein n=1 Tax=Oceanicoccus sagamiensis TaxID=716816 RepID=A0A1X9NI80_9GAMM|nr:hypothetical protein [Oceanicoccus sagamiensis]ARN74607.1 hypothetical protein BST96_11025 [Oceanicoccus sagamiensis]